MIPLSKPRLLDLFCGGGGAAMGYYWAGFEVVGIDINPQPHYPFEFHQADALEYPLDGFDVIHASPPCQHYSNMTRRGKGFAAHPDLIALVREKIKHLPYVIENVVGAPLINPVQICGSSFLLRVRRHRLFESNLTIKGTTCDHQWQNERPIYDVYQRGKWYKSGVAYVWGSGGGKAKEHWADAMGIDWMTTKELTEAIPPAYTEHLGRQILNA